MPMSLRTLLSTNQRASVNWHFNTQETACWASTRSAIRWPTPMPQAYVICCNGLDSLRAIITLE